MRRVSLVFAMAVLLAGISVSAQDNNGWVCVQSDTGNALLVFNSRTGDYKFVRCSDGAAFSGTGQVRTDGCLISLNDTRPTHEVSSSVNTCTQQGKGSVRVPQTFSPDGNSSVPAMQEGFGDSNLRDNTCGCTSGGAGTGDDGDPGFIGPPVGGGGSQGAGAPPSGGDDPEFIGPPEGGGGSQGSGAPSEFIVKSDGGQGFIAFNPSTGDYKFVRCDGVAFSGTGQIRNDGCFTTLEDSRENFRVFVVINVCDQVGKAQVDVPNTFTMANGAVVPAMRETYGDSNLRDSTASCGGK